jgi:hypothetical protein
MLLMDASSPLLRLNAGEQQSPLAFDQRLVGARDRARVDGKFLARGPDRLHVHGVTHGPFTPGPDGAAFPLPRCVEEDFARMGAAGINSIRTYHLPPSWLLDQAEFLTHRTFLHGSHEKETPRTPTCREAKSRRGGKSRR